jgi:hypothetical protein
MWVDTNVTIGVTLRYGEDTIKETNSNPLNNIPSPVGRKTIFPIEFSPFMKKPGKSRVFNKLILSQMILLHQWQT